MVKKHPFQIGFITLVKIYVVSGGCQIERFAKDRRVIVYCVYNIYDNLSSF
ncbi:MAG: hypothetical protein AB1454_13390 [Candidatus Auribacterota bacterium]